MNPFEGVSIAVAPNGARRTKADHPRLPVTIDEIAECARACQEAGAAMIHLHVRDAEARHTLDADTYKRTIDAVRSLVGDTLVIQITTEAAGLYASELQMQVVRDVRPEAASMALRELCPRVVDEAGFREFLEECDAIGTTPQHILYTPEDVHRFCDMRRRGVIAAPRVYALAVIGSYAASTSDAAMLEAMMAAAAEAVDCDWTACAFGHREQAILLQAAKAGWHLRLGFENNTERPDGAPAESNARQVQALANVLRCRNMTIWDAAALRRRFL